MGTNYYVFFKAKAPYADCQECIFCCEEDHCRLLFECNGKEWFYPLDGANKEKCFIPSPQEHPILEDEPIEKKIDELREQFSPVFDKITDPEGYIDEMRKDDWDE